MALISRGFSLINRIQLPAVTQVREYAARKGTRDKRAKSKVKVEVEKVGFIPHNQRNREKFLLSRPKRKFDDSWKQLPIDNVYPQRYYQWRVYPFQEAILCHRETHHPEVYNKPNSNVHITIELNMEGEKKTRFVDNFTRIAPMPNGFDHGEQRSIIAFTKNEEYQEQAKALGATIVGGLDLIREVQNGSVDLQEFQFILAEPQILAELVVLRGVMRRKFPNVKLGTLDMDIPAMVKKFMNGVNYTGIKDEFEKDFGIIETVIGTLDMNEKHLEENFASLVEDVMKAKPKRPGQFIRRCLVTSPPSREKFKVDHNLYLQQEHSETKSKTEEVEAVAAAN
ncbi:PREDICTED: 50S ribosomal protein L1 [Nicrophorus vespilloides]|uniref:50S ribosomal protein L1 n=1 Tax=Nicrophorus vespilloides TaxID=110193 RepID=A0ABM1N9T9_NICVS|nr:PREDICTED: 50S ribosomal protein L1 [Nicrophorus vespilloides]